MNSTSPPPPEDAPLLEWALWYASQGWPVFPCYGKQPLGIAVTHGFHEATCDETTIRHWWGQWPQANIGVPVQDGHVVLDIDPRKGGDTTLHTLQLEHGQLPDTLTSHTGGDGLHLSMTSTVPVKNKARIGDGIDVQGPGSYVIAPPSIHPETGKRYVWDAAYGPDSITPQPAPAWLENLIRIKDDTADATVRDPGAPILAGTRETTLMALAGAMQRISASTAAIRSALDAENQRCVPPLAAADLDRMTRSVGRYAPAPRLEVGTGHLEPLTPLQKLTWTNNGQAPTGLQILQAYWYAGITGAWRSGTEPTIWWLRLQERDLCLGNTLKLQDQKHVRACILEATGILPPFITQKRIAEWDACLMALATVAQTRNEPEIDPANQARELLRGYLESKPYKFQMDFDDDEWQGCARNNQPFRRDGCLYIHCRQWHIEFLRHLTEVTYAQALGMLRLLGTNDIVSLRHPRTSRYYWRLDATMVFPPDDG